MQHQRGTVLNMLILTASLGSRQEFGKGVVRKELGFVLASAAPPGPRWQMDGPEEQPTKGMLETSLSSPPGCRHAERCLSGDSVLARLPGEHHRVLQCDSHMAHWAAPPCSSNTHFRTLRPAGFHPSHAREGDVGCNVQAYFC